MATSKKKKPTQAQVQALTSDREKWQVIFNSLKLIIGKLQSQLHSLLDQRCLLQHRVKTIHDRWVSDICLFQDEISQMKRQLMLAEMDKFVEISKGDLKIERKLKESRVYKAKLEHAESELNDFKAWFDILSHRCPDQEDISPDKVYESLKATGVRTRSSSKVASKSLENEVAELKREYDKLSVKSSSEKSALQDEIKFVWYQYKQMENKYTDQLRTKSDEVEKAYEKIAKLIENLEQMQSSNTDKDKELQTLTSNITKLEAEVIEKDGEISRLRNELDSVRSARDTGEPSSSSSSLKRRRGGRNEGHATAEKKEASSEMPEATVTTLRARITKLEAEANEKNQEISALSNEVMLLRSKIAAGTPVLRRCAGEPSSSRSRSTTNGNTRGGAVSSAGLLLEQGNRRSKRKQSDMDANETPRLFTQQFKIPKLKTESMPTRLQGYSLNNSKYRN